MADYTPQRELANRLITSKGTSFTFSNTETAADPNEPWKGGTPGATGALNAVRVEPSSAVKLGIGVTKEELVNRALHILIAAPGDGTVDPRNFDQVTIAGTKHKISFVEVLDPDESGGILYFVGAEL